MAHNIIIRGKNTPPKVSPPVLDACFGDKVTFEARGTEARIFFPKWPFTEDPLDVIRVPEGTTRGEPGERATFTLREIKETEQLEEYPYSVYCFLSNSFAVADSDPIIIIKR